MGRFVKICGVARGEDAAAVAALRPDAVGFVFWPDSPRAVRASDVAAWTRGWSSPPLKVGVFVDPPLEDLLRARETAALDAVQIHGAVPADELRTWGIPVWMAVNLERFDMPSASGYDVDAWVADSGTAERPGGTGRVSNWTLARRFIEQVPQPVLLAGGLTPDNLGEALARVDPWGVDVSSGVELRPGRKDMEKVRAFIEQCRD